MNIFVKTKNVPNVLKCKINLIFFSQTWGFQTGGRGGGSPTWEKFPHFPVFLGGSVPKPFCPFLGFHFTKYSPWIHLNEEYKCLMLLSFVMPAFSSPAFTGTWKLKTKNKEQKTETIHSKSRYLLNIFEIVWTEFYLNILFIIYVFHWAEYVYK